MSDVKLGQLASMGASRDAIHIAIAPVTSDEYMVPGEHVGMKDGKASSEVDPIGIVDPFLKNRVEPGDTFYLCLYQQTVTGMKHLWSHPAFEEQVDTKRAASEKWLRDFAEEVDADYHEMMDVALSHCSGRGYGDYLNDGGKWEGQRTPDEFWVHYENVTGLKPKNGPSGIFSCSC